MTTVVFTEFKEDRKRVSFTTLLHSKGGIKLAEAKKMMDNLIDGHLIELEVSNYEIASEIVAEANSLGVTALIK